MFPTLKHRVVIVAAMAIGAVMWISIYRFLQPVDGSSGLTLMSARIGIWRATLLVAMVGVVSLGLGLIASAMGNSLGGVFAVSAGLCALAIKGGRIDGWILRSDLPSDYGSLMMGLLVWQGGVACMLIAVQWLRSPVRALWPALAYEDHLGVDIHLRFPQAQAWAAGFIGAVCGFGIACVLIRTSDVAQVIGSLIVSFAIGGLVAGLIFPCVNPVVVLFSPAVVAVVAYAYMWLRYDNNEAILRAWYDHQLPGVMLVLPIHFVSAGVVGCTLGMGLAQVIEASKVKVVGE